ncbi:MAG: Peptidyl-prolyl cis-trans isomerase [Candidatus Kapaibacterium sp.]|jgi:peptidyl-prolyl cis-trans isomerase B (cyclophilin B)|nr:MAG: Peptidyl-prolyl cis-trans isomerase [Candidatus Kapabacteria bacterium]
MRYFFLYILVLGFTMNVFAQNTSKNDNYVYVISLKQGEKSLGEIKIRLFPDVAPQHCRNFDSLVSIGFYNGTAFHRVVPGFMMQGGCPNSKNKPKDTWGMGDPSQRKIPAEFSKLKHKRGTISAARTNDPNSATSQFFICFKDAPWLDGNYTVFGEVVDGFDVLDKVEKTKLEKQPYSSEVSSPVEKIEMTIKKISK